MAEKGYVHSFETAGMVDGPGIRFVIFMQGCPLRCLYCHNPDTWKPNMGTAYTTDELVKLVLGYKTYISSGGVTISGGEPLLQYKFVKELCEKLRTHGIHTAIDTSGGLPVDLTKGALDAADMALVDLKGFREETFKKVTGISGKNSFETFEYLAGIQKRIWVRYVLVPGLTDNPQELREAADYLAKLGNVERIELNAFHKMGEYKWQECGIDYALGDTLPPTAEQVLAAKEIFRAAGLEI